MARTAQILVLVLFAACAVQCYSSNRRGYSYGRSRSRHHEPRDYSRHRSRHGGEDYRRSSGHSRSRMGPPGEETDAPLKPVVEGAHSVIDKINPIINVDGKADDNKDNGKTIKVEGATPEDNDKGETITVSGLPPNGSINVNLNAGGDDTKNHGNKINVDGKQPDESNNGDSKSGLTEPNDNSITVIGNTPNADEHRPNANPGLINIIGKLENDKKKEPGHVNGNLNVNTKLPSGDNNPSEGNRYEEGANRPDNKKGLPIEGPEAHNNEPDNSYNTITVKGLNPEGVNQDHNVGERPDNGNKRPGHGLNDHGSSLGGHGDRPNHNDNTNGNGLLSGGEGSKPDHNIGNIDEGGLTDSGKPNYNNVYGSKPYGHPPDSHDFNDNGLPTGFGNSRRPSEDKPEHGDYEKPEHGDYEKPGHGSYEKPGHGDYEKPGHRSYEKPGHGSYEKPDHGSYEKPGHGIYEKPGHGSYEKPAHDGYEHPREPKGTDREPGYGVTVNIHKPALPGNAGGETGSDKKNKPVLPVYLPNSNNQIYLPGGIVSHKAKVPAYYIVMIDGKATLVRNPAAVAVGGSDNGIDLSSLFGQDGIGGGISSGGLSNVNRVLPSWLDLGDGSTISGGGIGMIKQPVVFGPNYLGSRVSGGAEGVPGGQTVNVEPVITEPVQVQPPVIQEPVSVPQPIYNFLYPTGGAYYPNMPFQFPWSSMWDNMSPNMNWPNMIEFLVNLGANFPNHGKGGNDNVQKVKKPDQPPTDYKPEEKHPEEPPKVNKPVDKHPVQPPKDTKPEERYPEKPPKDNKPEGKHPERPPKDNKPELRHPKRPPIEKKPEEKYPDQPPMDKLPVQPPKETRPTGKNVDGKKPHNPDLNKDREGAEDQTKKPGSTSGSDHPDINESYKAVTEHPTEATKATERPEIKKPTAAIPPEHETRKPTTELPPTDFKPTRKPIHEEVTKKPIESGEETSADHMKKPNIDIGKDREPADEGTKTRYPNDVGNHLHIPVISNPGTNNDHTKLTSGPFDPTLINLLNVVLKLPNKSSISKSKPSKDIEPDLKKLIESMMKSNAGDKTKRPEYPKPQPNIDKKTIREMIEALKSKGEKERPDNKGFENQKPKPEDKDIKALLEILKSKPDEKALRELLQILKSKPEDKMLKALLALLKPSEHKRFHELLALLNQNSGKNEINPAVISQLLLPLLSGYNRQPNMNVLVEPVRGMYEATRSDLILLLNMLARNLGNEYTSGGMGYGGYYEQVNPANLYFLGHFPCDFSNIRALAGGQGYQQGLWQLLSRLYDRGGLASIRYDRSAEEHNNHKSSSPPKKNLLSM